MSRGPPHRYNPSGDRFRGYTPRYGEFSGHGFYGPPPYKRSRHLSEEDINVSYGPGYYDPPHVRHQEVGLGEFNDFSTISEKDIKLDRGAIKKESDRSEILPKKRQAPCEGIGQSSVHRTSSVPTSPSSKVSPRISPHHSPRGGPTTPPLCSPWTYQSVTSITGQLSLSSKPQSSISSDDVFYSKQRPLQIICPTPSHSFNEPVHGLEKDRQVHVPGVASLLLLQSGSVGQEKELNPPAVEAVSPSTSVGESSIVVDSRGKEGQTEGREKDDQTASGSMLSKDELLQSMERVDREIAQVEQQITNLKKKQKQLEEAAMKQKETPKEEVTPSTPKPKSIVQIIYEDNWKKAEAADAQLAKLGIPLPGGKPLYNQPSDLPIYHENLRRAPAVKAKLVKYFQLRKQAREIKNRQLCKEYKSLKQAWLKRIERIENNAKRKAKEAKLREFYEKVFPEIKKQREQTERFTRMGSRSNWGIVARSEAEFNEIVDNLNEQEANERHMRTLAVEPPPMLDKEERRIKFINRNGLIRDPLASLNERKYRNIWTEKERRVFKDKFIHNPKDFDLIASFLPGKSVADCILFYYQTKKKEHYKQLSRRHNLKKRRRDQFVSSRDGSLVNKTRIGALENSAGRDRGGSEGEDDLDEITDSAEESEENEPSQSTATTVVTTHLTTPTPSVRHTGRPDHVETSRWSEKEIGIALQGLRDCGRDWEAIARRVVTKTGAQCKNFYFNYKKKLHLEAVVAEHEASKMQHAQRQQQQQQQQQQVHLQLQQQQQPKGESSATNKSQSSDKPMPSGPQSSENNTTVHPSNPCHRSSNGSTLNPASHVREPASTTSTVPVPEAFAHLVTSSPAVQSTPPRAPPSLSPCLPPAISTSAVYMPTQGVIAFGGMTPSITSDPTHPGHGQSRPSLSPESSKLPSSLPNPQALHPGVGYSRVVQPGGFASDLPHVTPPYHPSSHPRPSMGSPIARQTSCEESPQPPPPCPRSSESAPLYFDSGIKGASLSTQGSTSHPQGGIVDPQRKSVEQVYPSGSSVFLSPSSAGSLNHRFSPHPTGHFQVSQDHKEGGQRQANYFHNMPGFHSSIRPTYSVRAKPDSELVLLSHPRRDVSPEILQRNPLTSGSLSTGGASHPPDTSKPDIIVIESEDKKKKLASHDGVQSTGGKAPLDSMASSMLRRLASAGNVQSPAVEQISPVVEQAPTQNVTSGRPRSHGEVKSSDSSTLPANVPIHTLKPPPPLIQVSPTREKKTGQSDTMKEMPLQNESVIHERHMPHTKDIAIIRDVQRRPHTPVESRSGERDRRAVETVDLTRDKEGNTSTHRGAQVRSSARATLQAMASAIAETKSDDATEKIPSKPPDTKLSIYEQREAIRKFKALPNVCVSAARESLGGAEYPVQQQHALIAMQAQAQVHSNQARTSTPPSYPYQFPVAYPLASMHHHRDYRMLFPVGVHHLPVRDVLPHSNNREEMPSHLRFSGPFSQYPHAGGLYPASLRSVVPTYQSLQPMSIYKPRYPSGTNSDAVTVHHPRVMGRHGEISEQDLANPFVVKTSRHTHPAESPERGSPHELPKFPVPARSPVETPKHSYTAFTKTQTQTSCDKMVTSSPSIYLSRIPPRPASVSEMQNRAAVVPELKSTDAVSIRFPEPQRAVLPDTRTKEDLGANSTYGGDRAAAQKQDTGSSLDEPTSAFATLVNVAAAARKVEVPYYGNEEQKSPPSRHVVDQPVDISMQRRPGTGMTDAASDHDSRPPEQSVASPARIKSPPSPNRVSPSLSGAPRYGITTGLVPRPPPLMPITGLRINQESSNSSLPPLSITSVGSLNRSRSPGKLASPPGSRPTRGSVSPDGPPPLIPRSVVSPSAINTSYSSQQGSSGKGPPPLISGVISPVSVGLRSPNSDIDSNGKDKFSQEAVLLQDPCISERASQNVLNPVYPHNQVVSRGQTLDSSSQPSDVIPVRKPAHKPREVARPHVRTIFETVIHLGSPHTISHCMPESHTSRSHTLTSADSEKSSSSTLLVLERSENTTARPPGSSRSCSVMTDNTQRHTQLPRPFQTFEVGADTSPRQEQSWQVGSRDITLNEKLPITTSIADLASSGKARVNESSVIAVSLESGSETEEGEEDELDVDLNSGNTLFRPSSASLHPRVRALAGNFQGGSHTFETSDSETLSAEESEVLPESSDEMHTTTLKKQTTQCSSTGEEESSDICDSVVFLADTTERCAVNATGRVLNMFRVDADNEWGGTDEESCDQGQRQDHTCVPAEPSSSVVTSTDLAKPPVQRVHQTIEYSDLLSASPRKAEERYNDERTMSKEENVETINPLGDSQEDEDKKIDTAFCHPKSFFSDVLLSQQDSSDALPAAFKLSSEPEDTVAENAKMNDTITSIHETLQVPKTHSSDPNVFVKDSCGPFNSGAFVGSTVPEEVDDLSRYHTTDSINASSRGSPVSSSSVEGDVNVGSAKYNRSNFDPGEDVVQSVIETETKEDDRIASGHNEEDDDDNSGAEPRETASLETEILGDADNFSSEKHNPGIGSAIDGVQNYGDLPPFFCTFVGDYVPQGSGVDSPDLRSSCCMEVRSERSPASDYIRVPLEKEIACEEDVKPSKQVEEPLNAISPEQNVQGDKALLDAELPLSQETNQSDDNGDPMLENEASPVLAKRSPHTQCSSSEQPETSVWTNGDNQQPSQSIVDVDGELSEGEIPESEDEATVEQASESPHVHTNSAAAVQTAGMNKEANSSVIQSPDVASLTDCYLDTVPISPAAPESPSQESEGDRVSPLPLWAPTAGQALSNPFVSLSLAPRMTAQRTAFPYSALSINVGSASSSARSSPVPQSSAVSLTQGSSPNSSSLLVRPQEPRPLLSDNYEPLSDDDDADISIVS